MSSLLEVARFITENTPDHPDAEHASAVMEITEHFLDGRINIDEFRQRVYTTMRKTSIPTSYAHPERVSKVS